MARLLKIAVTLRYPSYHRPVRPALLAVLFAACGASQRPPSWKIVEQRVQSGDASLYVRAAGGGDPAEEVLVFVHGGWGLSHEYLLRLEPLASPELRVVFYDQRGVGRSTGTLAADPLAQAIEDLDAVRRALGQDRIHVAGHSAGGLNAILYAAAHPERTASLILLDSIPITRNLLAQGVREFEKRRAELAAEGLVAVDARSPEARLRSLLPVYFSDPRHPAVARGLGPASIAPGVNERHLAALGDYDVTARLQSLSMPVLVYFSEVPFGEIAGRSPSSAIAPSRTTLLSYVDCGHFPWLECPDRLLPAIRAFLAGVTRPRARAARGRCRGARRRRGRSARRGAPPAARAPALAPARAA
jgi:proline iminopeptidase